uniref:EF-hand domain-containing protein n=1 Tax=Heterorhabditis bacteriophora TaxID=37862 RepID=A0A1I7XH04_HETBA
MSSGSELSSCQNTESIIRRLLETYCLENYNGSSKGEKISNVLRKEDDNLFPWRIPSWGIRKMVYQEAKDMAMLEHEKTLLKDQDVAVNALEIEINKKLLKSVSNETSQAISVRDLLVVLSRSSYSIRDMFPPSVVAQLQSISKLSDGAISSKLIFLYVHCCHVKSRQRALITHYASRTSHITCDEFEKFVIDEIANSMPLLDTFSLGNHWRILDSFRRCDRDESGMLSLEELRGNYTPLFLERVFATHTLYEEKEIDFRAFVDFNVAVESREEPASIRYLFRCVDLWDDGYLCREEVKLMVDSLLTNLISIAGGFAPSVDDVVDEIFDMAKPVEPTRITLDDIIKSTRGSTIFGIMIDIETFIKYENRENEMEEED